MLLQSPENGETLHDFTGLKRFNYQNKELDEEKNRHRHGWLFQRIPYFN